MQEKKLVSVKEICQEIIGNWLLWALILQFISIILFKLTTNFINSSLLKCIIFVVIQFIVTLFIWKIATQKAFKGKFILYEDVPKIMKNLTIFTIIICIIISIFNFSQFNNILNDSIEEYNNQLKTYEKIIENIYDDDELSNYYSKKETEIISVKNKEYLYLTIFQIIITIIYIVMLFFEKNELLNYATVIKNHERVS